jgi:uncharacterized protein HemX
MKSYRGNASNFLGDLAIVGTGAAVAFAGIWVVLHIIRGLVYFYYHSAAKLNEEIKAQADFLDYCMSVEEGTDPKAREKQRKALNKLTNISNTIETKILKMDTAAKKEMRESDRESFNPRAVKELGTRSTSSEIVLM